MYRKNQQTTTLPEEFELPFGGKLSSKNRWVIMANLIPWLEFEEEYASHFSEEMGAPAKSFRMALGALIIKEKLGISDRETVEQIKENPYLQYFLGMNCYSNECPLEASMLVHFRTRIKAELVNKINQKIVSQHREGKTEEKKLEKEGVKPIINRGKLILDATCAPADISYPNDLGILNQARIQTEKILDILHLSKIDKGKKKPKTYRKKARKEYLKVAKKRRSTVKERRKALKKQLQYIKRNSGHIDKLIEEGASLKSLSKKEYKMLLVVAEVTRQQLTMFESKSNKIENRIVNLSQPHIRPIVRGKAGKPVEFGAKLSVSYFNEYVFLDKISWDNFNESGDLKTQVEAFKNLTGYYPESVHVDKIYRTRENRAWCKERGIRISGPPLGRPPLNVSQEEKKQAQLDESFRNCIEGKFGQAKRRFSLNRVMTKLPLTSETSIAIIFFVINLSALLRLFFVFFIGIPKNNNFGAKKIIKNYSLLAIYNKNLSFF